ncbi:biotin/lipoyl-binding protein, partial [Klebsiella pneumoniae]
FLAILIATTVFCSFTQRIDVQGEVITLPHSVNVYAPQQGFVISQYVKVGDIVTKGQPLYEIDISRNTTTGNVSAVQIEVINEKIANAEDIISKLNHNKEETTISLEKQLKTINDS